MKYWINHGFLNRDTRPLLMKCGVLLSKLFQTCTSYLRQKLNLFPELVFGKSSKIAWKFRVAMKWDASS